MKKLLIVTNVDWFLISHRLILAEAAKTNGWEVHVACQDTGRGIEISQRGINFIPFSFSRSGTNPFNELSLIIEFIKLYRRIKPDVIHQITIKPVVYGTIAAKILKIKGVINAISGMGYMFVEGKIGLMQNIILGLMRYGANRSKIDFIFQNQDDMNVLLDAKVLNEKNKTYLIKGSGVNLNSFPHLPLPNFENKINILLPCRMLWDKGVKELKEATEILKTKYFNKLQFILLGSSDDENKSSVPSVFLNDWQDGEYVVWLGHRDNVVDYYKYCHIVILPSYREGLPKSLIEACAIGRPIITTDAIGCKDCVDEGINGLKVPVKNSFLLAEAIEKLINNKELMISMGNSSRLKAENEFNVENVVTKHLEIYEDLFY